MRRIGLSTLAVAAPLVAAAGLRIWGPLHGELVWHPDEIFMVVFPLGLFNGDLNPHQFHYPGAHFYVLGALYGFLHLIDLACGATGGLYEWVALHGLFQMERLRDAARWVSIAFSVGTVGWTALAAGRLAGRAAAVISASALAVSVLHVRQAQIASVDSAMTFWFVAALWAALCLQEDGRLRAYLLSGLLVGLCAGTKYPGVAAAGGVLGAHLLAGRGVLDRRLWAAGAASVVAFTLVSPFVWLDFGTFLQHFRFQLDHVWDGTANVFLPAIYHLWFSLRYSLGEPAWVVMVGVVGWAILRRNRQVGVVLCAFLPAYTLVSWGELVFVRYAMPMFPVQAILVSVAIVVVAGKLANDNGRRLVCLTLLTVVILALPTARSIRVATISAAADTRTQAGRWLELHVSSGSRCCNFGGWGGDVQVRTFEQLWWLLVRHEESFGLADLARVASGLEQQAKPTPYYSFTAGGDRSASEAGSWELVDGVQCDYVLIHDHPLPSSRLDTAFVAGLRDRGRRLVSFSPGSGIDQAVFDVMDAYYVPFADMGGIQRPGPKIEIWHLEDQPTTERGAPSVKERLSRAHALMAMGAARDGQTTLALRALHHASGYDPTDPRTVEAWARLSGQLGRVQDSEVAFRELDRLEPNHADGLEGLSRLLTRERRLQEAVVSRRAAARLQPRSPSAVRRLAWALVEVGRHDEALGIYREALAIDPRSAATNHDIGAILFQLGDPAAAAAYLDQAVQLAPDSASYYLDAGVARQSLNQGEFALRLWQRAAALDSALVNAHRYIAYAVEDLGDTALAIVHWQAVRSQVPADGEEVLEGARAFVRLGLPAEAAVWVAEYLDTRQDTTATADLQQIMRDALRLSAPSARSP